MLTELKFAKPEFAEEANVIARREIRGHSLIEAVYPPMLRVPNHAHAKANFCIALEGTCTERYAGRFREYKPLSLDFLPANHAHSLVFDGFPLRCLNVDVAPHVMDSLRAHSLHLDESVHCHGGDLAWLFMRLYSEFRQDDAASSLAIEALVLELLASVARTQTAVREPTPPRWLQQAKDLLHAHFLDDLSVCDISRAVGVHPVHLSREFRRRYHSTVGECVRRLRIEYACREMLNPEISLAEIASASGFADQSHFSRTFKRIVGMPPGVFRAKLSSR